jgi:hypothetical protein
MSEYVLTVRRVDPNPSYNPKEVEKYERWPNAVLPTTTIDTRVLEVVLTDVEWEAIKHAVLEVWK